MENKNHLTVVKSNKVIEASYLLSLSEQRVLLACIAQIDSMSELTEQYQFEVSASEIVDLVGLDNFSNAYRDLKKAAEKLYDRSVTIDDPDPENPKIAQRKTRWISSIDYIPGEGKLVLSFASGIIPYISKLSKEFTKYKLKHVARFESIYSIRLYELLVQWSSTGEREIEVEWLKNQFQVSNKYSRLGDLKRRVIEPAIAEINEHSNLWVKYGQRKSGRTVTHFQFQFGVKDQPKQRKKLTDEEINSLAKPGETKAAVVARLTGTLMSDFAKPGESWGDAKERKKSLKGGFNSEVQFLGSVARTYYDGKDWS
ncbi:conserved hypothetical protein [Bathymodiolus platifrons methanotrophic gill symbiont]|uniref:RepB family plasmid replication initiator protein n=1 Tax=Bathymodiolus platifrons methanotrophic gill symbiont TaxID=113268 RepID=UPI000B66B5F2|nr:RepB family plasmid replication initiator protein [Bathymodiolus platifrons methanotrophic gill symbiont]GAW87719.1 conserved hypothetical protein [Bathymodiolus platifrons methanotrophic gill symbiont]GFO76563.1 hypothetical protein BPLS_P4423 [Bathymodiolus platifrons methanotrophic gill symbiont]